MIEVILFAFVGIVIVLDGLFLWVIGSYAIDEILEIRREIRRKK